MSDTGYETEFYGPEGQTDADLCKSIGDDLIRYYPGHPWMVGVDLAAGSVVIDLGYSKPHHLRNMAYFLWPSTVMGPGREHRLMQAGGELLERFGIGRSGARKGDGERAAENGLEASDTKEGAWAIKKATGI